MTKQVDPSCPSCLGTSLGAGLRALEVEAAKRVGYRVELLPIKAGATSYYVLVHPDGHRGWVAKEAGVWDGVPTYATDLNACWRDLVAWLTARGYGVGLDTDEHKTQAVVGLLPLYRDPPVYVTVKPPAHPAEAVLRAFLQATEEKIA